MLISISCPLVTQQSQELNIQHAKPRFNISGTLQKAKTNACTDTKLSVKECSRGWCCGMWVKVPQMMPASHVGQAHALATPFPVQLPENAHVKAAEDGVRAPGPAPTWQTWNKLLAPAWPTARCCNHVQSDQQTESPLFPSFFDSL